MIVRKSTCLLAAALLFSLASALPAQEFFFKKGDVVVVMGDSITEQRLYSNYLEIWSQTRFPSYNLVFRNVGIGGDRSTGGNNRFKRDVLPLKATALTVDFGMNDGNYNLKAFDEKSFAVYMKGLQGIADQAKAANVRVAWVTPQPVEHNPGDAKEAYNMTLEKFSDGVKEIAGKNNGAFADQFHPYWAVIKKARDAGEKGRITAGDAVHPGAPGQALMAASILKALNFPKQVSSVAITVAEKRLPSTQTKNCKVSEVGGKQADGGAVAEVTFTRHDFALPYFPEQAKSILKWAPLLEEMNDYGLRVKGLKEGKYDVKLGGKKVATFTAAELAKGVNLAAPALALGPVADQVKDAVKAVNDKTTYYHDQIYRGLILANVAKHPDFKDVPKEGIEKRRQELIAERMQKMPELDAAIRKALEPRTHQVAIVVAK
jgi:lysophospholipase L1-like esterase